MKTFAPQKSSFNSVINVIFGIGFASLGLFFLYLSGPRLYQLHLLEGDAVHGSGVVKELIQDHGRRSTSYTVWYEYYHGSNLEHAKEAINEKDWFKLKESGLIPILYVKTAPGFSRIDLPGEDHWQWQNSIGVAGIASVFVFLGIWLCFKKKEAQQR